MCGGVHAITITIGEKPVKRRPFAVKVEGAPKVGDRVTKGPDWSPNRGLSFGYDPSPTSAWGQKEAQSGVVHNTYQDQRLRHNELHHQPASATVEQYRVKVKWNQFSCSHVWGGPEGCYEIELL